MEEKKSYRSLPSNYVTLAQLQERWLKQHNQPQPQHQEQQNQQQPQPPLPNHHQAPRNGTVSPKKYRLKNRNDSRTHRPGTEAASDDHRKPDGGTGIGDENASLNGKVSESKKKWKTKTKTKAKRKPKAEENGASDGATAQRNEEEAEKTTIESELNDKKKEDSSITVEEVEQKVRVLSMNKGNGEQNVRLRKMNNGNRQSQSKRNYYGDRGYGYGYGNGQSVRVQRREKMVWVKKDGT